MKRHSVLGIGADFFSGVLVGGIIGFSLDLFFETKPWLLCLFIILGFGAGVRNVMKSVEKMKNIPEGIQKSGWTSKR